MVKSLLTYKIDDVLYEFNAGSELVFNIGEDILLSNAENDLTYNQEWYPQGYTEKKFLTEEEFNELRLGITESIKRIIAEECSVDVSKFDLENYHHVVLNDDSHYKIVSRTRDLFSGDFIFSLEKIIKRLSDILNINLTDFEAASNTKMHVIVRINRPGSHDYNPPHKDVYEGVDIQKNIPKFINFWIPIAGVTAKSNLPIAPGSHLVNEKDIMRTFEGGQISGNKYRVRMIKDWDNSNALMRSTVKYGEVLIFSSHLIHGLAVNNEKDKTRVALEFRLFRK
jgi:hypothetical protein